MYDGRPGSCGYVDVETVLSLCFFLSSVFSLPSMSIYVMFHSDVFSLFPSKYLKKIRNTEKSRKHERGMTKPFKWNEQSLSVLAQPGTWARTSGYAYI